MHIEASYLWRQVAMLAEAQTFTPNGRTSTKFASTSRYKPVTGRPSGSASALDEVVTATRASADADGHDEDERRPPGELVDILV